MSREDKVIAGSTKSLNILTESCERRAAISERLCNKFTTYIYFIFACFSLHAVCVQCLPTFARVNRAELSLDRPIRASNVAPRPLGGVWVSAVIVISSTYRRNDGNSTRLLLIHVNTGLCLSASLSSICLSGCCVG